MMWRNANDAILSIKKQDTKLYRQRDGGDGDDDGGDGDDGGDDGDHHHQ